MKHAARSNPLVGDLISVVEDHDVEHIVHRIHPTTYMDGSCGRYVRRGLQQRISNHQRVDCCERRDLRDSGVAVS
eukprot:1187061-Prorocentrum_minimum.AAC.2